jgi:hypothetical protein
MGSNSLLRTPVLAVVLLLALTCVPVRFVDAALQCTNTSQSMAITDRGVMNVTDCATLGPVTVPSVEYVDLQFTNVRFATRGVLLSGNFTHSNIIFTNCTLDAPQYLISALGDIVNSTITIRNSTLSYTGDVDAVIGLYTQRAFNSSVLRVVDSTIQYVGTSANRSISMILARMDMRDSVIEVLSSRVTNNCSGVGLACLTVYFFHLDHREQRHPGCGLNRKRRMQHLRWLQRAISSNAAAQLQLHRGKLAPQRERDAKYGVLVTLPRWQHLDAVYGVDPQQRVHCKWNDRVELLRRHEQRNVRGLTAAVRERQRYGNRHQLRREHCLQRLTHRPKSSERDGFVALSYGNISLPLYRYLASGLVNGSEYLVQDTTIVSNGTVAAYGALFDTSSGFSGSAMRFERCRMVVTGTSYSAGLRFNSTAGFGMAVF